MTPPLAPPSREEFPTSSPALPTPPDGSASGLVVVAELAGSATSRERSSSWRRWFHARSDWPATRALISREICCQILDVYLWVAGVVGFVSALAVYVQQPVIAFSHATFGLFCGATVVQLLAAVLRGLPFSFRYALLAVALMAQGILAAITIGIGPVWFFVILLFLSATTLFYGRRAGAGSVIVLAVIFLAVAWGWVNGRLPVGLAHETAAEYLNFRHPSVWVRVMLGTGVGAAGLLLVARQIVRSLNDALAQSTAALRKLAVEQEQRAQAVEALRASEQRLSKIFRFSPDAIAVSDLESGRYLDVNDGFVRVFGYTRDELIGRTGSQIGLWVREDQRLHLLELLRRDGAVHDFQATCRRRDGAIRTFLLSAEVVEISGPRAIVTAGYDITDRLQAERALRESEEKFSTVFRTSPIAILMSELQTGRIIDANEAFLATYKCTREQAIGHTTIELGVWSDAAARETFLRRLEAEGAIRNLEIVGANCNGDPLLYLLSAECMEFGGRTCVVSIIHDITERKQAEDAKARAVESERQAREVFTRRLIAAQEAERRRIAGELHDSLGQNLLLVKNRAQLALTGGTVPSELRWQFESIHDMAGQALAEVRQISHDLRPYQIDQLGLTRALEGLIDGVSRNTGFRFERKIEPVDDVLTTEATIHVYRIVQEGLSNILKHARANSAHVLLERDVRDVRLWIEDDGCGFTPGETAVVNSDGGLGLKNIAERTRILGGTWCLDSSPGRGTRLEVIMPTAEFV